jgi:hypothetical protein
VSLGLASTEKVLLIAMSRWLPETQLCSQPYHQGSREFDISHPESGFEVIALVAAPGIEPSERYRQ